jgi:hypothetical protein
MGVRETLNQKPAVAAGAGAVLVGIAILAIVLNARQVPGRLSQAFYTDDDGATYFADDIDKVTPIDHNVKPALRANVYRSGDKPPFVAYVSRHTEAARARIAELSAKAASDPESAAQLGQVRNTGIEVRKPKETKWVGLFSREGEQVTAHPHCPEGGQVSGVYP